MEPFLTAKRRWPDGHGLMMAVVLR